MHAFTAFTGESATLLLLGLSLLLAGKVLRTAVSHGPRRAEARQDRASAILTPVRARPRTVAVVD